MANTKYTGLTNYANYHTFSKLQVGNNVNFGGSINRSGHTVTNTDAWLDDVPFFNTFTTPSAALSAVGTSTVKNDLVSIAVGEGDIPAGLYRRNTVDNTAGDKTFTEIFTLYTIGTDKKDEAPVLLNKNDKAVVRVWSNQQLTLLDGNNNSNANSEGQAARIIVNNAPVEQFIAVPDVCRSGYPSNGYSIKVYNDGTPMTMDFGTVTNTFFDVPFAGVIMFGGGTDGSVYTIDCFEYIGDKLAAVNTKIADIQDTIENLTLEAGEGIKQIKTTEGSGITVVTEGVEGATKLTPVVSVDTTVIATKASVDAIAEDVSEIQETIESGVVSSVTVSNTATTHGITVNTDGTKREIDIEALTSGAVLEGNSHLVTGDAVHNEIRSAVGEAIANSKVIITKGTGINVTASEDGLTYTVAVDNTVATTQSVTDLADRVTSAEGEIDILQEAVEGLTSGENSVDSKIAAAKTEITGTEITEQSVSGAGITVTLDGTAGAPTLTGSVTTATYTPATETAAGSWSDETNVAKASDVKAALTDITTKHTADIEKVEAAIESLSTSGFSREIVTDLPTTDIKLNAIYLVANKESNANEYVEYIYVGGTVTDGQVSGGRFEQIGTTKTDLSEYAKTADVNAALDLKADQTALDNTNTEVAKKANSTDVYTTTQIDSKVTTINNAIEAAAAKGQQGITDAAAAKSAADAAQADATQALADAATAQSEVDTLEGVVSALSQVVTDNKAATDTAIATKADQSALDTTNTTVAGHTTAIETLNNTTIPAITGRLDAIEAIPTAEVVADEGNEETPNYVTVSSNTADGKTTFTIASTAALEERLDTLDKFISGSDGEGISELLAKKVDNVTGGSNGITITTADTTGARVATLSVTPDTTVTKDSTNVVTSGAVEAAISGSASTTLDTAKAYAEEQVEALATELNVGEVSAENTAVSVTQTNGKITAVTVTKGEIVDKNANLVDGGTVYAATSALETAVSKKLDSSTYTADKQAIEGRLDSAEGEIDALQEFVNGANDAYAAKSTETTAANAQSSADKKLASITTSDARITISTATADGDSKSQAISLASNVATVDKVTVGEDGAITVDTEGDVYSKESIDKMVAEAAPDNYVKSITVGSITTSGETVLTINDGRTTVYPNDLWGTTVSMVGNTITVQSGPIDGTLWGTKNGYNTKTSVYINGTNYPLGNRPITKVENNKVYNPVTTEVANIKTNELVNGDNMFSNTSLESFSGDLSSLVNGYQMFSSTSLTSFSGDLSSLVNGSYMFYDTSLESFSGDLSSLVNGYQMFSSTSLTSFSGDLSSLVNGSYMFCGTSLESFSGDLSSLLSGSQMFYATSLTSFSGDLSSLVNGDNMFYDTSLESFSGDLSSLVNGYQMFSSTSLTSFSGDLSSLVNGDNMFSNTSLTSFDSDLSSLVEGYQMFSSTSLESFSGDLSNLVDGRSMFYDTSLESFSGDLSNLVDGRSMFSNTSLTSFSGDLSSLVNGDNMFSNTSLTSFSGDLSSLVDGSNMFSNTSLDVESVELICDVLPNYNTENGGKTLQTATWNESGENKGKYTYSDWNGTSDYYYPIIKITNNRKSMFKGNADGIDRSFDTEFIGASDVKSISITWSDISVLSEADRTKIAELFTNTATEKGWTFLVNTEIAESGKIAPPNAIMAADGTIQYYVLAKKDEATEDNATHIDASGKLWKFDTAEAIIGPNIMYWSMFATVEDALTEWELTPWTKPTEEETEA